MRWEQSGSGYANSVTWGYDDNNNLSTQKQTLNGTTYTTSYTYDKDNRLKSAVEGKVADRYGYDSLGRLDVLVNENDSDDVLTTFIGYQDLSSSATSGQVKTWKVRPYGRTTYLYEGTYSYDARGNITAIKEADNNTRTFVYDSFDQLISEENPLFSKKWTYSYDDGGNILSKQEYVTSGQTTKLLKTTTYTYGDEDWPDLLTAYNGESITYDGIGNPLSDGTWTYTWQHGRQLSGMSRSGTDITYSYDADGLRISKTVNGTTYHYYYLDSQLVEMTWDSNKLHFTYDSVGPASVNYNGTIYNYIKNAQGDVVGLVDFNGTKVVEYIYDAWGNHLSTFGTMASTLGKYNPLRYRGYVYDTETGLYYLQSRYYNPTWGRFINADDTTLLASSPSKAHWDKNVFAYCDNNPLNRVDEDGECWNIIIGGIVGGIVSGASTIVNDAIMGRETTAGSVLKSVFVGAATGVVSAGLSSVDVAAKTVAVASGLLTCFGNYFIGGSSLSEALIAGFTTAVATYLSTRIVAEVASGKTLMEGVINFNVSSAIETVSSTVRGIYVGIRSKKNTQTKKSTKPTEKVSIPLPTPKTPKIPSMVDSILQDWQNGRCPQLLPMG